MRLSVIIISYNTQHLTCQAVRSVFTAVATTDSLRHQTEVWVVDNNSSDGSPAAIKALQREYPNLKLIQNQDNRGFAAANNQALRQAKGQLILLLNSDTIVAPPALAEMVAVFAAQPPLPATAVLSRTRHQLDHIGILSAQLHNPDGSIQAQGGSFPTLWSVLVHFWFLDDVPLIGRWLPSTQHTGRNQRHQGRRRLYRQDWVGGTAMMIRQEVLAEIGLLDERIFMYGEDMEFCLRAAAHHWDVAVLPSAQITHYGSASAGSQNAILGELKGYLYIWAKHKPSWQQPYLRLILGVGVLLRQWLFGTMFRDQSRAHIYQQAAQLLRRFQV